MMLHSDRSAVRVMLLIAGLMLASCAGEGKASSAQRSAQAAGVEKPSYGAQQASFPDHDYFRDQIERNWNLGGSLLSAPDLEDVIVDLRIRLLPDGTVASVAVVNSQPGNPTFRDAATSAVRAVMFSSPLRQPPDKTYEVITIRLYPGEVVQ